MMKSKVLVIPMEYEALWLPYRSQHLMERSVGMAREAASHEQPSLSDRNPSANHQPQCNKLRTRSECRGQRTLSPEKVKLKRLASACFKSSCLRLLIKASFDKMQAALSASSVIFGAGPVAHLLVSDL